MARILSNGKCNLCGGTFSKQALSRHLELCRQKEDSSEESTLKRSPKKSKTFHILVEGRYLPDYWMHLEIPADATFETLDRLLRRMWLECCGHMSAFRVGETTYSVAPMAEFNDKSMRIRLNKVLTPGMKFYHEYDFGSTTHLALKVIGERESKGKDIQVLARNNPPTIACNNCGAMATQICTECLWSDEGQGWLCDKCVAEHKCDEDMLLPVVNSPRVGTCGYTGD